MKSTDIEPKRKLQMANPVNICPMCKRVVPRLYKHKRGQITVMMCGRCKEQF